MWTLIIIIVVVVVVDDDTYCWVYLSSNHLFQVYYKVRQVLLQSATAFFITKCDGLLLQSATAFLLQSTTSVITKCDRYYKVWQFYYKVRQVLQSATIITKCDSTEYKSHIFWPVHAYLIKRWEIYFSSNVRFNIMMDRRNFWPMQLFQTGPHFKVEEVWFWKVFLRLDVKVRDSGKLNEAWKVIFYLLN